MSVQTYMGIALKAQAQCRVTGETVEKIRTARAAAPAAPKARPEPSEDAKSANEPLAQDDGPKQ